MLWKGWEGLIASSLPVTPRVHGTILELRPRKTKCIFQASHCLTESTAFTLNSFLIQETYPWLKREIAHKGGRGLTREAWPLSCPFHGLGLVPVASALQNLEKSQWELTLFAPANASTLMHNCLPHWATPSFWCLICQEDLRVARCACVGAHWGGEAGVCLSVLEQLVDHPTCITKDGSLLSLNSLGNRYLPSSFGAGLKGSVNRGPSTAIKWSPVLLIQPLALGLWAIITGAGFIAIILDIGARNGSLCVGEMCHG